VFSYVKTRNGKLDMDDDLRRYGWRNGFPGSCIVGCSDAINSRLSAQTLSGKFPSPVKMKKGSLEMKVSVELLSHILTDRSFMGLTKSEDAYDRLVIQAREVVKVNLNRYHAVLGDHIVQNTVNVAYHAFKQWQTTTAEVRPNF